MKIFPKIGAKMFKIYIHMASKSIVTINYNSFEEQQKNLEVIKVLVKNKDEAIIADQFVIRREFIEFVSTEN